MTGQIFPALFDHTSGTLGQPDARATLRAPVSAELVDLVSALLEWAPNGSVLTRRNGSAEAVTLTENTLLGSTGSGPQAITSAQIDEMLGLTNRFAGKAPTKHSHSFLEVVSLDGGRTLADELALYALTGHQHGPSEIATTAPSGYIATSDGSKLVMLPPPSGSGSGNVNSPLTFDLDLAAFGLVSGVSDVLRYSGGRVFLAGNRYPELHEATAPTNHQVWIHDGSSWEKRRPAANDILAVEIAGVDGSNVSGQILSLKELIDARAELEHTHGIADLDVPAGAQPGWYMTPAAGGGFEVIPLPSSGGGGITSPLTADLDIAARSIRSGAQQLLSWSGTQVLLGGEAVFPSTISSPLVGHVPVYNPTTSRFVNRLLAASESTVTAIAGGLADGADVQAVLESLAASVGAATLTDTDGLAEGSTNLYATTASVQAAGAVMDSEISDDETLATLSTSKVVSERAIKVAIDAAVAAGGGGGGLAKGTTFPGSPSDGDVFHRTDLRETFQFDAGVSAWIGATERVLHHYTGRLDPGFGQGAGGYILGTGNAAGYRVPFDAVLTGASFQNVVTDTGQLIVRKAPEGGSVVTAITVPLTAARGDVVDGQLVEIDADQILSAHVSGFALGVSFATLAVSYRRRIDV